MGFGQSDVIISQYIETNSGSTPKGIEIFNISGASIDFSVSNLEIYQGTNGASCSSLVSITSGVLATDQVWVVGTSDLTSYSTTNGSSLSGTTTYGFSFNGDDALELYLGGILQDQFGICGVDPGSSWSANGVSTANQNIAVQNGLCDGDIDGWADPSIRFTTVSSNPVSDMSGFGNAPTPCSSSTDEVDWANVQFPANGAINLGDTFNVYAQTLETGLTDSVGQGAGIQAWIGYNTSNIDPSDASWTWVVATYNTDSGNNDEYVANIGTAIPSTGTYYYASRFQLNSGPFKYGGYNGGFWDGTTNVNGVLTVNARILDWCNLQYPGGTNSITTGTVFDVFAQVYESGVTDTPASQGANIQAWVGYSTSDTNPNSAGWTWIPANYNPLCGTNCGTPENNDEYFVDIGSGLPVGTYYYASRFTIDDPSIYYYGGYNVGGGDFWDGITYISGILNVTPSATCASESFVNSGNSGSYGTETWTGDDGINWTATDSRTDQDLNGNEAVMLRNGSLTNDSPFPNGCGVITFDYAQIYSGSSTLQVFVNGIQYGGDINVNSTTSTTFSTAVNVTGNISVELRNTGNRTLINNLSWTCNACATPTEATNLLASNGCGGISLNWDMGCAEEVMLVARQGSAVTAVPSGDGSAYTADTSFGAGTDLATGEYDVYEGTGTFTTVTGLTNGATYYFTLFSRVGSTWTAGITSSATYNVNILNPGTFSSYNRCGDIELTWILPACYEEVLVIARDGSAVTASPSGDGSSYTANANFTSGTAISPGQFIVYQGTGDIETITGLTDGNTYHFEIFTRVGTTWSSGITTSATASTGGGSGPTTFNPGDLVFVGFDSYINGANDKYSILSLVDIGPGTEFIIANLLYEWNDAATVSNGKWYDCDNSFDVDPPFASIQYSGCSDIPKGSIICVETAGSGSIVDISINGISTYSEFTIDATNFTAGNISTSNPDAIWLMQGTFSGVMTDADGSDAGGNPDRYRTFSGTVFGGLQTKGYFQQLSSAGNAGGNRVSRIHPDIECLYLETGPTSNDRFFGFYYGITVGSQYQLLANITNISGNWDIQSGTGVSQQYDEVDFTCNDTFTITSSGNLEGQWIGGVSTDWFDCHNWQSFTVPDATVDVVINSTSTNNCDIDDGSPYAPKYNYIANCNDIDITSRRLTIDSNGDVLNVFGSLNISASGILDMNDGNNSTADGLINLYGSWTNSVAESSFDEGNSTVVFMGSGIQRVNYGGPPTPPAFQTEEFYNVILDNNFDTYESNDLHVNGDLTINALRRLDVRSGDYVFVNQTVTNNNIFYIEDSASLVQSGNGTNTNVGNIIMDRAANSLQVADYVYWSSPINQFNVNDIFSTTSHIYKWNPTASNGNGGQGTWESAIGNSMAIGEGYIVRVPNSLSTTSLTAQFTGNAATGIPNNGDYSVTISRGSNIGVGNNSGDPGAISISVYDDNWNLVGNPYPSAISVYDFLTAPANSSIDGFVCLWRHINAPSSNIDPFYDDFGDGTNYTHSDYVYYNLTGVSTPPGFANYDATSGSDRYIAAGQSFLVNMNEGPSAASSSVVFNNSMRDIFHDNSQFFRTAGEDDKHRLWVNLYNSNFDAINTILIGYVPEATMERDRLYDMAVLQMLPLLLFIFQSQI